MQSIEIPADRIPPIAKETANNAKSIAAVLFFVAALFTLAAFTMTDDGGSKSGDSAYESGKLVGTLIWPLVFGLIGLKFYRAGKRATAAAERALSDSQAKWLLSEKIIIAHDARGVPNPDETFKISSRARAMLLAVPAAKVVDRS